MAIATVLEAVLQGEAYQTYSGTVKDQDVVRGMVLSVHDNGEVKPATTGERVRGIALFDAVIDEEVTYALVDEGAFVARLLLTESQTVSDGDPLCAAPIVISGVTTIGLVAKQTDAALTALTQTFTDFALGATPTGSEINTAANALIDELDAMIVKINTSLTSSSGIQTQAKSFVGFALEDKTTTTDEAKVIKVLVKGASL